MDEHREPRRFTAEFELNYSVVGPFNMRGVRLFRAPTVLDTSGAHKRLPHEISWNDVSVGDLLLAIHVDAKNEVGPAVNFFEVWHVVEAEDESFGVYSNRIVPPYFPGHRSYDQLAKLVGLPPCSTDL